MYIYDTNTDTVNIPDQQALPVSLPQVLFPVMAKPLSALQTEKAFRFGE